MAKFLVQHRRGTSAQWADKNTIIPREGEIVIEIDEENSLHKLKIGDGVHTYSELAYLMAGDEIVTQVLAEAKPRIVTVELTTNWVQESNGKYGQEINIDGITSHSRLDLQPDATMLAEFKDLNLVFTTENTNGAIIVYSVGDMPLKSYTMQATIVETDVNDDCEKVVGMTVGTPTAIPDWNQVDETKADFIKNKPTDQINGMCEDIADLKNNAANAIKGSASGNPITLSDISPLPHDMSVFLTKKEKNPTKVKIYSVDQNEISYHFNSGDGEYMPSDKWYIDESTDGENPGWCYAFSDESYLYAANVDTNKIVVENGEPYYIVEKNLFYFPEDVNESIGIWSHSAQKNTSILTFNGTSTEDYVDGYPILEMDFAKFNLDANKTYTLSIRGSSIDCTEYGYAKLGGEDLSLANSEDYSSCCLTFVPSDNLIFTFDFNVYGYEDTFEIQLEEGKFVTEYTNYVECEMVDVAANGATVEKFGKNYSPVESHTWNGCWQTLSPIEPLKIGKSYLLIADTTTTSSDEALTVYDAVNGNYGYWKVGKNVRYTFTPKANVGKEPKDCTLLWIHAQKGNDSTRSNTATIKRLIIVESQETELLTATDGNVSTAANGEYITLLAENGVTISAEYNKDTNKVIESLVNAIIAMGGNV